MNTAVILALIALAGSLVSTVASTFGFPEFQARRDARRVLDTYREPLVAAAYELQSRLYNILSLSFLDTYFRGEDAGKRGVAITSTLYVFAQFFGWREIVRQEVQFLRFPSDQETRKFSQLLWEVGEEFLDSRHGVQFMFWRVEQRGFGERMIVSTNGRRGCLGYAAFLDARATMTEWLQPLEHDLENLDEGGRQRLASVQHLLVDLVRQLDDNGKRYPVQMDKA